MGAVGRDRVSDAGGVMQWDPRVSMGNLLTIVALLLSVVAFYARTQARLAVLETVVAQHEVEIREIRKNGTASRSVQ